MVNNVSQLSGLYNQMVLPDREMRRPDLFNQVDSDGSGGIYQVEISDLARKLSEATGNTLSVEDIFSTYDSDGDGQLSQTELDGFMRANAPPPPGGPGGMGEARRQAPLDDLFAKVDQNDDGRVSKDELSTLVGKIAEDTGSRLNVDDLFAGYDADGDGALSKTELDGFMRENAPPPPHGPNPAATAGDNTNAQDILSSHDTDEDGKWSAAELQSFLLQNFSQSTLYSQKASGLVDRSV
ncbi:MAG: EF-hand domain-containing protein [Deltaproteobacteria bacterium]|nr:EF-hand domain-containing protein [Deltaproteobacteria bacterium]